jgi:hypothetical protein
VNRDELGGDATSGYEENGHYYVKVFENNDNSNYKEVPCKLWYLNYCLSLMTLVMFILSTIGFLYLMVRYAIPFLIKHMCKAITKSSLP